MSPATERSQAGWNLTEDMSVCHRLSPPVVSAWKLSSGTRSFGNVTGSSLSLVSRVRIDTKKCNSGGAFSGDKTLDAKRVFEFMYGAVPLAAGPSRTHEAPSPSYAVIFPLQPLASRILRGVRP
jgi:hypothetical protein